MTIYRTLLGRGYFPKELPPSFSTDQFAVFATSKQGRSLVTQYKPPANETECVDFELALPGLERRHLLIPHPASFGQLAVVVSKNFRRLLRLAGRSQFSRSRAVYSTGRHRAIHGMFKPSNLGRERTNARAGASYLLRADISQFYPSLYTHAVGWAIDPKLREPKHRRNGRLLGKQVDQALMNLQGKISQGIPVGNDVSFLLAEVVLAQIDRALRVEPRRSYRWFDDYELACDTREEAEGALARLADGLDAYRLRLNPAKTEILRLPLATQDGWQDALHKAGSGSLVRANEMVRYFDATFRIRQEGFEDTPILLYAIGLLYKIPCPRPDVLTVALSGIMQAILAEPGAAQKAFSLLTYWDGNGASLDTALIARTIDAMIVRHRAGGVSSDIAWALSFCIQHRIGLSKASAKVLAGVEDDSIGIQAMHMCMEGLLPGFKRDRMTELLGHADLDGKHWLAAYEMTRQQYLTKPNPAIPGNPLFAAMLARGVSFYRRALPSYAAVIHPGGAPEWLLNRWIRAARDPKRETERVELAAGIPVFEQLLADIRHISLAVTDEDAVQELVAAQEGEEFAQRFGTFEPYA